VSVDSQAKRPALLPQYIVVQHIDILLTAQDGNNTEKNRTYLDNPLTNGEPDALLRVTQNWNPGGGRGVYNNHPIGVLYDADTRKWAIYNRDGASMPDGAAFNIAVSRVPNP
jgi:hypothetical protein